MSSVIIWFLLASFNTDSILIYSREPDHSTAYSHLGGRRERVPDPSTPSTQMTVGCGMVWLARLILILCMLLNELIVCTT